MVCVVCLSIFLFMHIIMMYLNEITEITHGNLLSYVCLGLQCFHGLYSATSSVDNILGCFTKIL